MNDKRWKIPRTLAAAAVAVGVAGGSYGIASAASGSGGSSTTTTPAATAAPSTAAPSAAAPWGRQRSDETLLTGDTASKVRDLALAKVPGGTIVRVETDADGHAAYEAHMVDADGNPVTVYVDTSFNVVSVESGGPGGGPGAPLTATGHTA
jgi:hypothetical protein